MALKGKYTMNNIHSLILLQLTENEASTTYNILVEASLQNLT